MRTTPPRPSPDWMTPAELAAQMRRTERWVQERMASGELPSVKVGRFRWWTPGCMRQLEDAQLRTGQHSGSPGNEWGRATRGRRL